MICVSTLYSSQLSSARDSGKLGYWWANYIKYYRHVNGLKSTSGATKPVSQNQFPAIQTGHLYEEYIQSAFISYSYSGTNLDDHVYI